MRSEFERNFDERGDVGAAFAAYVDGVPVVDLWGGFSSQAERRPWERDTLVGIYSGTKGLVATCMLMLLERGQLSLDEPVCRYWKEFGAHGKDRILVRHVLSHQAGIPGLETPVTAEEATDGLRMARLLAAQEAVRPPGTEVQYHALTFGWICGELMRRVDGRSIGRFLQDELSAPLQLEAWIGLPYEYDARVAVLECGPGFDPEGLTMLSRVTDPIAWSVWANPPRFAGGDLAANSRSWRAAEIPASNGVASARAMARLYGCLALGGELDKVRIVSRESVELAQVCLSHGLDGGQGHEMSFSAAGFELQTRASALGPPPDAFGFSGAGGSMHGAWPGIGVGFSYAPNLLSGLTDHDPRADALLQSLFRCATQRLATEAPLSDGPSQAEPTGQVPGRTD